MIQFILGALGVVAISELTKKGGMSKAHGGSMNYYLVTFGYNGDDGYEIVTSKPILANSEDEASMMLKQDFEMNEGISCDIISVKKKI